MSPSSRALREERRARIDAALAEAGLDALVVAGDPWRSDYLRYAVDATPLEGRAIAILERGGAARLFVDSPAEGARFARELPDVAVSASRSAITEAERAIGALIVKRVALAPLAAVPCRLAKGPFRKTIAEGTALLDRLMLVKSPREIDAVRKAAALADEGYRVFREAARAGRAEYEPVAEVEAFFRSRGCPENFQILASGGREVRGMHPPGERRLREGDLVTTELTPCVDGYYAQICRTLVIGRASGEQRRAFAVYDEALRAGLAALAPGATAGDVARAENGIFRREGLGDYVTSEYTRVRGHGLGLYVDSRPMLLEDVALEFRPGMTLIVHPNTYHPEVGYFVHGDSAVVTESGCEVLTRTARALFEVPA
ncbi:MAG TPA: Xaa-Pro peptidase family protein [Burkholderiales bacterium]